MDTLSNLKSVVINIIEKYSDTVKSNNTLINSSSVDNKKLQK